MQENENSSTAFHESFKKHLNSCQPLSLLQYTLQPNFDRLAWHLKIFYALHKKSGLGNYFYYHNFKI